MLKTCRDTLYDCTKEGDQYVGKGDFLCAALASFFQGFLAFFIPYLIFKLFNGFFIVKKGNGKIDIKEYSDQSETVHKPIQKR